jgi:LacI family transcriptional regulator
MAKRIPTMRDVAQLAGVGTMTVSRFLNGSATVSRETAERVDKAIHALHYKPNQMARALRGQRSRSIGLILPYLYDPFFAICAHAITEVAKQNGYTVLTTTSDESPDVEYNEAVQMLQRYVEGLILIPANNGKTRINRVLTGRVPLVSFDRPIDEPAFDQVLVQNQLGAQRMVEHLIEHGHRRIAFMGLSRNLYTIEARFKGYQQAMLHAGLEPIASFDCATLEGAHAALEQLLGTPVPPTACFTANTLASTFVVAELHRLGIKTPEQVALAGFDDFFFAATLSPALSVVRQPVEELGHIAAVQLFARLKSSVLPQTGTRTVLPVSLVLRQSCGCTHTGEKVIE